MADQKTSPDITNVNTTNPPQSLSRPSADKPPTNPLEPLEITEITESTPRSKRRTTGILIALFVSCNPSPFLLNQANTPSSSSSQQPSTKQ